jgi:hypothetical protein
MFSVFMSFVLRFFFFFFLLFGKEERKKRSLDTNEKN